MDIAEGRADAKGHVGFCREDSLRHYDEAEASRWQTDDCCRELAKIFKGAVGAYLGLLSGLRRPPDLGYQYRRIVPEKVAGGT